MSSGDQGEGGTRQVTLSDFDVNVVNVDITKTRLMDAPLRRVDKESTEGMFKDKFKNGEYGMTESKISIAIVGVSSWSSVQDKINREGTPAGGITDLFRDSDVLVVDGQHRRHVLLDEDVLAAIGPLVQAYLYTRKDGKAIDLVDCLRLGYELNDTAALVRPMTPVDHVYTGLSFIRTIVREGMDVDIANVVSDCESRDLAVRIRAVTKCFMKLKVLPHSKTSIRQYATIVAGCYPFGDDVYDALVEVSGSQGMSSILKFQAPVIWQDVQSADRLKFRLKGIHSWHVGNLGKGGKRPVLSENHLGLLVQEIDNLYTFFCDKAQSWGKSISEVFEMKMDADWPTVGDFVAGTARSWKQGKTNAWLDSQSNCANHVVNKTPDLEEFRDALRPRRATAGRRTTSFAEMQAKRGPSAAERPMGRGTKRKRLPSPRESDDEEDMEIEVVDSPADGGSIVAPRDDSIPGSIPVKEKQARSSSTTEKEGGDDDSERYVSSCSGSEEENSGTESESGSGSEVDGRGDRSGDDGEGGTIHEEQALWRQKNLPIMFEGGQPGEFSVPVDRLPDASPDDSGKKVLEKEFVQLLVAKTHDKAVISQFQSGAGRDVPDVYTDGFRVLKCDSTSIQYENPSVRCGYYPKICLLHEPTKRIWMTEVEGRKTDDWHLLFDDIMPSVYPFPTMNEASLRRAPFNWARRVLMDGYPSLQTLDDWEVLTSRMPMTTGLGQRKRVVLDQFMWLRSLGLRPPHRAFFALTADDLERVHEDTYLHAHYILNRRNYLHPRSDFARGRAEGFFRAKRAQMDEAGYCILEGFARSRTITMKNEELSSSFRCTDSVAAMSTEELIQHFQLQVPSARHFKRPMTSTSRWISIINRGDGKESGEEGNARYSTTRFGMVEALEAKSENEKVVRARAELDVRILQAAKCMRLRYDAFEHAAFDSTVEGGRKKHEIEHPPPLYAPDSGGRFLGTGPRCEPQKAHCDFSWYETAEELRGGLRYPGYFSIVTSDKATPLWVSRGSHRLVYRTAEEKSKLAKLLPMEKIMIPPFSIFFGRGDLTHAGAGFDDADRDPNEPHDVLLRYHLYLVREEVPLTDSISYYAQFRPLPESKMRPMSRTES